MLDVQDEVNWSIRGRVFSFPRCPDMHHCQGLIANIIIYLEVHMITIERLTLSFNTYEVDAHHLCPLKNVHFED